MLAFVLPILMQVGIAPTTTPVSPLPPEIEEKRNRTAPMLDRAASAPAIETCLSTAASDPDKAADLAREWIARTDGEQRAAGRHCLGVALGRAGDWAGAAAAFVAARDEGPAGSFRARMGALAGSAYLAESEASQALAALDSAKAEPGGDAELTEAIALDRATALVSLERLDEAATALAEARLAAPGSAQAWLLSATLARRTGDLARAQEFIEKAGEIDPRDPMIGLEAGVIAALDGREAAARKSFESVLLAAPEGPIADAAHSYLDQLKP